MSRVIGRLVDADTSSFTVLQPSTPPRQDQRASIAELDPSASLTELLEKVERFTVEMVAAREKIAMMETAVDVAVKAVGDLREEMKALDEFTVNTAQGIEKVVDSSIELNAAAKVEEAYNHESQLLSRISSTETLTEKESEIVMIADKSADGKDALHAAYKKEIQEKLLALEQEGSRQAPEFLRTHPASKMDKRLTPDEEGEWLDESIREAAAKAAAIPYKSLERSIKMKPGQIVSSPSAWGRDQREPLLPYSHRPCDVTSIPPEQVSQSITNFVQTLQDCQRDRNGKPLRKDAVMQWAKKDDPQLLTRLSITNDNDFITYVQRHLGVLLEGQLHSFAISLRDVNRPWLRQLRDVRNIPPYPLQLREITEWEKAMLPSWVPSILFPLIDALSFKNGELPHPVSQRYLNGKLQSIGQHLYGKHWNQTDNKITWDQFISFASEYCNIAVFRTTGEMDEYIRLTDPEKPFILEAHNTRYFNRRPVKVSCDGTQEKQINRDDALVITAKMTKREGEKDYEEVEASRKRACLTVPDRSTTNETITEKESAPKRSSDYHTMPYRDDRNHAALFTTHPHTSYGGIRHASTYRPHPYHSHHPSRWY
jgi:hypothetical protein